MKLSTLRQHGVGERDAKTAAFVPTKQIRQAASLVVLLRRETVVRRSS
jgi:hypothetical protein